MMVKKSPYTREEISIIANTAHFFKEQHALHFLCHALVLLQLQSTDGWKWVINFLSIYYAFLYHSDSAV